MSSLAYFDTSVLVKRYVRNRGSSRAEALLRRHRFVTSAVAPVEVMSALVRRRTGGDLSQERFQQIVARVRRDRAFWDLVQVTDQVVLEAEAAIDQTGVRTLDAVHIASAVVIQSAAGVEDFRIPFITSDAVQFEAASRAGLETELIG